MSRRNIRLTLGYDGTDFAGWQIQLNARTVQAVLQEALEKIHGSPVRVTAAGRTDSGVHATGQVVNFFSSLESIPVQKFADAINSRLPPDVRVIESDEVPEHFNSRKSARLRVYHYYLYNGKVVLPHCRRYCYHVRKRLRVNQLNCIASVLVGGHDFTTFAASGDANESKVRRVSVSCFYPHGPFIVYKIAADSFLWKMVRSILGTILDLGDSEVGAAEMRSILLSQRRERAGQTVPAQGLFLSKVFYNEEPVSFC